MSCANLPHKCDTKENGMDWKIWHKYIILLYYIIYNIILYFYILYYYFNRNYWYYYNYLDVNLMCSYNKLPYFTFQTNLKILFCPENWGSFDFCHGLLRRSKRAWKFCFALKIGGRTIFVTAISIVTWGKFGVGRFLSLNFKNFQSNSTFIFAL